MKDKPLYEVLRERLLRSFLDIEIVSLLVSKEEVTGYEIVLFLHRKTGRLFSPRTIYPILLKEALLRLLSVHTKKQSERIEVMA